MILWLFLSGEAALVFVASAFKTGGDTIIYLATIAGALGVLYRFVVRPARMLAKQMAEALRRLESLDEGTIEVLACLPEWQKGMDLRMGGLENAVKGMDPPRLEP